MPFQVGCIDDAHDHVGSRLVLDVPEKMIDGDHFVGTSRSETVRSRKVDDLKLGLTVSRGPFLFLDRDARIVADVLTKSRQGVEERGFPSVRVSYEGHGQSASRHEGVLVRIENESQSIRTR